MRDYEIVYIFAPSLDEAGVNEKLDRYHGLIAGENGGEITAVDHWGKRQLAYPVENQASGYYVVTQFNGEADALPEFERILKLDEELLRYLIVVNEAGFTTSPVSVKPPRDEDDEDEEGED